MSIEVFTPPSKTRNSLLISILSGRVRIDRWNRLKSECASTRATLGRSYIDHIKDHIQKGLKKCIALLFDMLCEAVVRHAEDVQSTP